jgi:hypothetical protein
MGQTWQVAKSKSKSRISMTWTWTCTSPIIQVQVGLAKSDLDLADPGLVTITSSGDKTLGPTGISSLAFTSVVTRDSVT